MEREFKAYRVTEEGPQRGHVTKMRKDQLTPGSVLIDAHYSSLNYKDALAVTGQGKILKRFPLNPGIDVAGVVAESSDNRYQVGDSVIVTGRNLGEAHDGGFAEQVRAEGDMIVPLPKGLSLRESMIYGTAGFTAALCLHRLLVNDQEPSKGPIVVTGASGGVGSFAIALLSKLGFEVIAVSGKTEIAPRLKSMGAHKVLRPEDLQLGGRPLEEVRFGGAIDNVGGTLLEGILRHVQLWGNVASVGLAGGPQFSSSVMPFILRGVSLLGISSNNCPTPLRRQIWAKLAGEWRPPELERFVAQELRLEDIEEASRSMLDRKTVGRHLVRLKP